MVARKRGRAEVEAEDDDAGDKQQAPGLLTRLRNMWVFANVMQFIWIFGSAFKIDEDFDIEDLEVECLNPQPHYKLAEIGLCLLKAISSQRGLTTSDFDEYTSRQYKRRFPEGPNPFGDDETPQRFLDFDVFTQLRVLHQLSLWTLAKPVELRERMKRKEDDPQTDWRIDPIGWDRDDRVYFLLDDSRLYRRTDPPIGTVFPKPKPKAAPTKPKPKPKPKAKPAPKPARQGTRTSKRLKVSEEKAVSPEVGEEEEKEEGEENEEVAASVEPVVEEDKDLGGGYKWECVAITLQEYQTFLEPLKKSRDANERNLYRHITDEVMPMLEKLEENRQKKIARRERELLTLEKMATAKRSSRIAGKAEKEREDAERAAAEAKRERDLAAARADEERKRQMEEARESRMMTREQRLKEREYKRILHEEELANMSEDNKKLEQGEFKGSERRLKADIARKKKELEEFQQTEEDWVFDCAGCGIYGENMDDGTPIISCERCNVWQHLLCLGISQDDASKDDFHFVCGDCLRKERETKQREEDAKKPKLPPLKFKYDPNAPVEEAPAKRPRGRPRKHPLPEGAEAPSPKRAKTELENGERQPGMPQMKMFHPPRKDQASPSQQSSMHRTFMNGPTLSPQGQFNGSKTNGHQQGPPPGLMSPPRGTFIPYDPRADGYTPSRPTGQSRPAPPTEYRYAPSYSNAASSSTTNGTGGAPRLQHAKHASPFQTPSQQRLYPPSTPASLANGSHQASARSVPPGAPALSPPDQKKLSPAAAPSTGPGYSPVKPLPVSPQPAAVPVSPAMPNSGSPVMEPPAAPNAAKGISPQKHNPPHAPPLAPIDTGSGSGMTAPSPATLLPAATFPSARPDQPAFSRQSAPPPRQQQQQQPPGQKKMPSSDAPSSSPPSHLTTSGAQHASSSFSSPANAIPPPVPAPQKALDSSPIPAGPPAPKHLPAPPPFAAPASTATPLPAPVHAPTKSTAPPLPQEAAGGTTTDAEATTMPHPSQVSPLAHSAETLLPPPSPHSSFSAPAVHAAQLPSSSVQQESSGSPQK